MALKYTGRADALYLEPGGKAYRHGDMVPISKDRAKAMMAASKLHAFEGLDEPDAPAAPPTTPAQAEAAKKS